MVYRDRFRQKEEAAKTKKKQKGEMKKLKK